MVTGKYRSGAAYPAGHPAALLILAIAPDLLAGWTRTPGNQALPLLPPVTRRLPRVPRLPAGNLEWSVQAVRDSGAGLIVDVGGSTAPELADIAAAAGVDLLTLAGRLASTPEMVRRLGRALGRTERGQMLAEEVERWLDLTRRATMSPTRIHYGCGPDALEVPVADTLARETFTHLGLEMLPADSDGPLARVTAADVTAFDPEWIVCLDEAAAGLIRADPAWRPVRAVAAGRVLASPAQPFLWLDRPPGINRMLGLLWLASRLRPGGTDDGELERCLRILTGRL